VSAERPSQPVRLVVTDDLHRSRLTVFFRFFLAIPHYIWLALLGSAVVVVVFINWFVVLFKAQTPQGFHDFITGFLRYATWVEAYVLLAANPFPGFYLLTDSTYHYPVDLEFDPPVRQNRWKTGFRLFLAIPATTISSTLLWGGPRGGSYFVGGLAVGISFLLWWVGVILGRSARGLRDLTSYCVAYSAQLWAYLFLVTDRYPYTGPNAYAQAPAEGEPPHVIQLSVTDDLRRSRVLVFFRIPIAIPHLVWWLGWTLLAAVTEILTWLCALVIGRPPRPFHRFLSAYLRYTTHLSAFFFLVANPFPGFVGKRGSYPVELELPEEPQQQRRLVTFFRLFLALPAFFVSGSLFGAMWTASIFGWFVALVRGQMPDGIRNLGGLALRYGGQVNAYAYVLTDRYPHSGPRPDPASP
jgi:hypothetical protein